MNEDRSPRDVHSALRDCLLFRPLDPETRAEIAGRARRRSFRRGDTVFRTGDAGHALMAILAGTVRISFLTAAGREVVLADLGPGDIFGEIAVLDGGERSADAQVLTDCEILELPRGEVLSLLAQRPQACLDLLALVCRRVRLSDQRMADIAFLDIPARIAKALIARSPPSLPSGEVRIAMSQAELAAMVGATREAVNRQLRDWQKRGLVEIQRRSIHILRGSELAMIAAEG